MCLKESAIMSHMEPRGEENYGQRDGNPNSLLGTSETFFRVPWYPVPLLLLCANNPSLNSLGGIKRGECVQSAG